MFAPGRAREDATPKPAFSFLVVNRSSHNRVTPARNAALSGSSLGGGHHPMGDAKSGPVRLWFNPQLRAEFHGATVTSDAGLLLARELDERLGLSTLIERHLADPRTGRNYQFSLPDLFRQSIYSRLAGYE